MDQIKFKPIQKKKVHTFTRKPHLYQILAYIFFLLMNFVFYFITIQYLPNENFQIICIILFTLSFLSVVGFTATCSLTDPTDPTIFKYQHAKQNNQYFNSQNYQFFCEDCDSYVGDNSKHCRRCDRCVDDFDHHCKWINNCIGIQNYKSFIGMIISVIVYIIILLFSNILALVQIFQDNKKIDQAIINFTSNDDSDFTTKQVFIWIITILAFILFVLDANLIGLHAVLYSKKLTTFQYIQVMRVKNQEAQMMKRQKQIKKQQQKILKEQQKQKEKEQKQLEKQRKIEQKQKEKDEKERKQLELINQQLEEKNKQKQQELQKQNPKQDIHKVYISNDDFAISQQKLKNQVLNDKPIQTDNALDKTDQDIEKQSQQTSQTKTKLTAFNKYLSISLMLTDKDLRKIKNPSTKYNKNGVLIPNASTLNVQQQTNYEKQYQSAVMNNIRKSISKTEGLPLQQIDSKKNTPLENISEDKSNIELNQQKNFVSEVKQKPEQILKKEKRSVSTQDQYQQNHKQLQINREQRMNRAQKDGVESLQEIESQIFEQLPSDYERSQKIENNFQNNKSNFTNYKNQQQNQNKSTKN